MILFPAIDLKDGQCVRLRQGDMNLATVFNADPAAQAQEFERLGFTWLHLVDLDGAFAGRPQNAAAVTDILSKVSIPVQLGGGIRDLATIESWLGRGVRRVILGTSAVRDPALVRNACRLFPGRVAVGIDARGGRVAVQGWAETTEVTAADLARRFEDAGVAAIIYTDIARDGVLAGLNLEGAALLAAETSIPVIASGGLASLDDVRSLMKPEYSRLAGAVAGRALYDGRLDARAALALLTAGALKAGDRVRVRGIPPSLDDDDEMQTKTVFARCVGRVFQVESCENGRIELLVGEVMGEAPYAHTIWIEPQFVEKITS